MAGLIFYWAALFMMFGRDDFMSLIINCTIVVSIVSFRNFTSIFLISN